MQTNNEKITREFCQGRILLFYPKTEEEAAFIQRKIFAMGFMWADDETIVRNLTGCVAKGMVLKNDSKLYWNPNNETIATAILCTSDQFDEKYVLPKTDRELLFDILEQFNKLSARIEKLEEYLKPQTLDKPVLKTRESAQP